MKIRIKFAKFGSMKFVGHLDTMRFFQRAIKRAGIDISYSTGFSPHPIMSFALPLGVGVESFGEYFDIQVNTTMSTESAILALNEQMPKGVEVLSYKKLPDDAKKSMSLVEAADYTVTIRSGYSYPDNFEENLKKFYDQKVINIIKQTKKSERELDIKPLIFDLKLTTQGIFMRLKSGSVDNIKPQLVLESFYKFIDEELPKYCYSVTRQDLYSFDENNNFISLQEYGEII